LAALGRTSKTSKIENGETRDQKWDELSRKVLQEVATPAFVMPTEGGSKEIDSNVYILRERSRS